MSSRLASSTGKLRKAAGSKLGLTLQSFLVALGDGCGSEVSSAAIGKYFRFSASDFMSNAEVVHYIGQSLAKYALLPFRSRNELRKLKWHSNDKFVFVWIIYKFCELKHIPSFSLDFDDWVEVGDILENDHEFLRRKWAAMVRHTTCLLRWSEEEEELLSLYMNDKEYQYRWTDLSIKIHESLGRHILRGCKDVRERWYNYLNPTLKKSKWTEEEDQLLKRLVAHEGKKWSAISRHLEGRTENQVKNRINSLMKRNIITEEAIGEGQATSETDDIRKDEPAIGSPDREFDAQQHHNHQENSQRNEAITSPLILPDNVPDREIESEEPVRSLLFEQYIGDDYDQINFSLL